jgi:uncharacterized phage-associated protein
MTPSEEKILNAIIYFVKTTKNCRKTKLFKLLYFFDFIHFKKYGTSVSGYEYIAMPRGPVPIRLYEQITNREMIKGFSEVLSFVEEVDEDGDSKGFKILIKGKKSPDMDCFSPNERNILEEVADMFKDSTATEMSEITHLKNSPWDKTKKTKGDNAIIDYFLAIDDETKFGIDEINERFCLEKELREDGRI